MSEFQGSPFGHSESLCTTTSSGRFFAPKDTEYKETSKGKKILFYVVLAAALVIAVTTFIMLLT